jgi:DNA polymerase III subunit alpha
MHHSDFVHLHVHTQYSLLDGAIRLDSLFETAEKFKAPAVAITDHGNMFGAIEFYKKAKKSGIKPIIGCEVYLAPKSRLDKFSTRKGGDSLNHMTLLVKNQKGYKNLIKLVSQSYTEGFYYKPRIDRELLSGLNEGLIALSGCLKGNIPELLLKERDEEALKIASEFKEMMGDRFYLEIQDQGIEEQVKVNKGLIALSKNTGIPLVATNDCHYLKKEDSQAHDILVCIQTGKSVDEEQRMRFSSDQFYFKSPEEMKQLFSHVPEATKNTLEVSERCNLDLRFDEINLPQYPVPSGYDIDSYLEMLSREGLKKRLEVEQARGGNEKRIIDHDFYIKRLEEELRIIKEMGFSGYFLVVWDFIRFAREKDIPVGPGRGSASGSLVAYALRITELDPIRYGLLFERFLNPERISMPDIDIDFCEKSRDSVIDYVVKKYKKENVAQIITFGTMKAKGVVRDVGRALNMPYGEVDKIAKLIPNRLNIELKQAIREEPRLKELSESDENIKLLLKTAKVLEGLARHASIHAAGVVISPKPLVEYVPLYKGAKGETVTQYPMNNIENLGLLKMDFLGLRTLTVIDNAIRLVEKNRGVKIILEDISLDDKKTYQLLSKSNTLGVFQLESSGMRDILRRMKPVIFEDIIALVALYRPGPLGSGMVEDFINRKHGKIPVKYELPQLEEVLKETYGVILYQEQVMRIASMLGGFSMGSADLLRRAMGKKKADVMTQQREKFVKGAIANDITKAKAMKIFDLMEYFAGYGFNKSHSASYALVAYQTAYLKTHYPVEFMAALLTSEMDNSDKVLKYMGECRDIGIKVLPPDVNESFKDFTVIGDHMRFGLAAVKNVGQGAVDSIVKTRKENGPFLSLYHFCESIDSRVVNRRVIESLIKCGAFDSLDFKRSQLMSVLDPAMERGQKTQKDKEKGQTNIFDLDDNQEQDDTLPYIEEWDDKQMLAFEKESLGFYITKHPLSSLEEEIKQYTNTSTQRIFEMKNEQSVSIIGMPGNIRLKMTKKGDRMAFMSLEDLYGSVEVIVFPDLYKDSIDILGTDEPVMVKGVTDVEGKDAKIIANSLIPFSEIKNRKKSMRVHINLHAPELNKDLFLKLKKILIDNKGESPVYLHLIYPEKKEIVVSTDNDLKVEASNLLISEVESLVGKDGVFLE